ncbi:MAG: hypothetical protein P8016_06165, partial [Sedimentisphaerales bacterium]
YRDAYPRGMCYRAGMLGFSLLLFRFFTFQASGSFLSPIIPNNKEQIHLHPSLDLKYIGSFPPFSAKLPGPELHKHMQIRNPITDLHK